MSLGLCQVESKDHGSTGRSQCDHKSNRNQGRPRREWHRDTRFCCRRRRCVVPGAQAAHGRQTLLLWRAACNGDGEKRVDQIPTSTGAKWFGHVQRTRRRERYLSPMWPARFNTGVVLLSTPHENWAKVSAPEGKTAAEIKTTLADDQLFGK